jgi:arginyl-tRNA---protein transferase
LPADSRASEIGPDCFCLADVCREKRRRRDTFDLSYAIHKTEYSNIKHPEDKKASKTIEPAHKFEVNLEGDGFTKEK